MERVQFQEEQMLPELKAFLDEDVFNQKEIKAIVIQRRQYESSLIRRISRKSDYLRYIEYEMSLEKLRKARVTRLQLPTGKDSLTEFSLIRRQFALFERALKRPKFAADVSLWIQYIRVAQKEGARTLLGRITARALSYHPNNPSLYILASSHTLDAQQSPSAARTLLQRGLRLNKDSVELWRAYVGMELGFVVTTGRRWGVLGISDDKGKGKEKQHDLDGDDTVMEDEAYMSVEARKEILNGAIVKRVISAAVEAFPKPLLLRELIGLVNDYPAPQDLRDNLLNYLHALLGDLETSKFTSEDKALRLKLLAARCFSSAGRNAPSLDFVVDSKAIKITPPLILLEAVSQAVGVLQAGLRATSTDETCAKVYSEFTLLLCGQEDVELPLKQYLVKNLRVYIQEQLHTSPKSGTGVGVLMEAHIQVLPLVKQESEVLKTCRRYCKNSSSAMLSAEGRAIVWLTRLQQEASSSGSEVSQVWKEARTAVGVSGCEPNIIASVWTWGLNGNDINVLEDLIVESKTTSSLETSVNIVHPILLQRYLRLAIQTGVVSVPWIQRYLKNQWGVDAQVWRELFPIVANADLHMNVVREVYNGWRGVASHDEQCIVEAVIAFAEFAMAKGETMVAAKAIRGTLGVVGSSSRARMEQEWTRLLEQRDGELILEGGDQMVVDDSEIEITL